MASFQIQPLLLMRVHDRLSGRSRFCTKLDKIVLGLVTNTWKTSQSTHFLSHMMIYSLIRRTRQDQISIFILSSLENMHQQWYKPQAITIPPGGKIMGLSLVVDVFQYEIPMKALQRLKCWGGGWTCKVRTERASWGHVTGSVIWQYPNPITVNIALWSRIRNLMFEGLVFHCKILKSYRSFFLIWIQYTW